MTITHTFLDDFRYVYTLNRKDEVNSNNYPVCPHEVDDHNVMKMLMWIPVISHILALALGLSVVIPSIKDSGFSRRNVMLISRCVIAFTVPPLLMPIDLVGHAVKYFADARSATSKAMM